MDETDYRELRTYAQGDEDWDHTDTVEAVEEDVPREGPLADRPASPPDGRTYWATDARILYRYQPTDSRADGDGWVPIAGLGADDQAVPGRTYLEDVTVDGDLAAAIAHDDLDGVGADDHHAQTHDNADHSADYLPASDYDPLDDVEGAAINPSTIGASTPTESVTLNTAVIAEELGLPEYDDVANAPQTQNRIVYATGDGASAEGIYKHDGDSYSQVGGGDGLTDGEDFDGQGASSFENLQSVDTERLQHSSADSVPQSVYANVSAGRPVVIADGVGAHSVAFDDFASDDAAIQQLVDWAIAQNYAYELHIPHFRADGENVSIDSTIELSDPNTRTVAEVYVHPGRWDDFRGIETGIDDGSPLFDFSGAGHQSCFRGGRFRFHGNDATLLEFAHTVGWTASDFWVEDFSGSGVRVNSGSFGWVIDDCRIRPDNPGGIAIELRNDDSNSPGYGAVGSGVVTETEHDASFLHAPGGRNVRISAHFEQATGHAMINASNGGRVTVEPGAEIGLTNNGCHGVSAGNGAILYASGSYSGNIDGDAIRVGGENEQIYSFQIANNAIFIDDPGGDCINIQHRPQIHSTVPYPSTIYGSVSYPAIGEGDWGDLCFPDGRSPYSAGTVTVPSGGVVHPEQWLGSTGVSSARWDMDWWVNEVPSSVSADARVSAYWGLDEINDRMSLVFEELADNGQDVDISYVVYQMDPRLDNVTA